MRYICGYGHVVHPVVGPLREQTRWCGTNPKCGVTELDKVLLIEYDILCRIFSDIENRGILHKPQDQE